METFKDRTWLVPFFVLESRLLIGQLFKCRSIISSAQIESTINLLVIYYDRQTDRQIDKRQLQKFIYIMSKLISGCSRCGSPVTDSLETEIEQHGKVVISTKMDVSYPAILIGTLS